MSIESKKTIAVGNREMMESLCHTCAYAGCTSCPSIVPVRGRNEKKEDFPHVTDAIELSNGTLMVTGCNYVRKRSKEKIKVQKPKVVFNRKTGKNEFVR